MEDKKIIYNGILYNNLDYDTPIVGKCYIVSNGDNYDLAFWDDELGFINKIGVMNKLFRYWTELPICINKYSK